VFWLFWYSKIL